jgi:hypothetical protein
MCLGEITRQIKWGITKRCTGVASGGFSVFRASTGRNPVNAVVALAFTNGRQHGGVTVLITLIDTMTYEARLLYPVGHPARLR